MTTDKHCLPAAAAPANANSSSGGKGVSGGGGSRPSNPGDPTRCMCGAKPATGPDACPEPWEPGCDLGANPAHVRVAVEGDGDSPSEAAVESAVFPLMH